jgi:hypothetical protein
MEITLVVAVLLGLISVLFLGVAAYKKGSDRATCILNISGVQKAVRSYANLYQLEFGDPIAKTQIVGPNKMIETEPTCSGEGVYTYTETIQPVGSVHLMCLINSVEEHKPTSSAGW